MNAAARQPGAGPVDRRTAWKILLSVVVVVVAVGALLFSSGLEGAEAYRFVDEVMANPKSLQGKRVRVHGFVKEGTILREKDTLKYEFQMETRAPRASAEIKAFYRGLVPDTFKSGAEVVAVGILNDKNEVHAEHIEAKCPSKYEGKEGEMKMPSTSGSYGKPAAGGNVAAQ